MMSPLSKFTIIFTVAVLSAIADIPILPVDLVSDAEAVFGVRRRTARRTAVVAYSAGAATAASASAATQQQAPPPQQTQPPPPPQQQVTMAESTSAVPVGTIVQALPQGCIPVTVGNVQFQKCNEVFYRAAFQGNSLVYVVVDKPL